MDMDIHFESSTGNAGFSARARAAARCGCAGLLRASILRAKKEGRTAGRPALWQDRSRPHESEDTNKTTNYLPQTIWLWYNTIAIALQGRGTNTIGMVI